MRLIKINTYTTLTFLILFLHIAFIPTHTFAKIQTLKIAGDTYFPPYEFVDKNGIYKGFNIDIMHAIALEMGVEIQLLPMPWESAVKSLQNGEIDAIQGMLYNKKRTSIFDYTEFTSQNSENIFVLKNNFSITDLESLSGKYAAVTLKGNKEAYDILNEGIKRIKSNGNYNKIHKKWFGEDFKSARYVKPTYALSISLIIILLIVIFVMYLNVRLKRMVDKKTAELLKNTEALKSSELKFRTIFEQAPFGIALTDSHTGVIYEANSKYAEILESSVEHIINKPWMDNTHPNDIEKDLINMRLLNKSKIKDYNIKKRLIKPDGSIVWVNIRVASFDTNKTSKMRHICMIEDITEQKSLEEKLMYLSYHDPLTNLYNRRFLEKKLKAMNNEKNFPLTLVIADVNGLKLVNDSFGHEMGDLLLNKVAKILKEGTRETDIVARLGGDEYIILLPNTNITETSKIIKKLRNLASNEKVGAVNISVSFGYETKFHQDTDINEVFKKAEDYMYKEKLYESPSMRSKTINVIIKTLHEKNKREEMHSHRVSDLCSLMGEALDLDKSEIKELSTAGLLHDIGKVAIEDVILNKAAKLTEDEWLQMKRHPEIGYRILNTVDNMSDIANYVLCHHERIDGKGYPKGLSENKIPLQSKIISIADSYDAMTSERSYRKALTKEVAIKELQRSAGSQFDEKLINIFIDKVLNI